MSTTFSPALFPRKRVTLVQPLTRLPYTDLPLLGVPQWPKATSCGAGDFLRGAAERRRHHG